MLIDRFNRKIEYLRISLIDKCDLRCSYCIPKGFKEFERPVNWLSFDEIERVVAAFARMGTRRFRSGSSERLNCITLGCCLLPLIAMAISVLVCSRALCRRAVR